MFNLKLPKIKVNLERHIKHGQRWYMDPNDPCIDYPSVTTVLSVNRPQYINDWIKRVGEQKAAAITAAAADRGTEVHSLIEQFILTGDIPSLDKCAPNVATLFNQFKMVSKNVHTVYGLELPLYSKTLKIAGTADMVCDYNGVMSLVDFKTSTKVKSKSSIPSYLKQATAYALAYNELYGAGIDQIVILIMTEASLVPTIVIDKIDNHIEPLLISISEYYASISKLETATS